VSQLIPVADILLTASCHRGSS